MGFPLLSLTQSGTFKADFCLPMNPYEKQDLRKFIDSFTPEQAAEMRREQIEDSERMFQEFIAALKKGDCSLCGKAMASFDMENPCMHWMAYPSGIKKKHFDELFKEPLSYYSLDAYLRWLSNSETVFGGINDLRGELSSKSYAETTIRFKNIEWAFSLGKSDVEGHAGKHLGQEPHYHLQMTVNGLPFIRFNDYHIRFTDADLFTMELIRQGAGDVHYEPYRGHGLAMLENPEDLKIVDDHMVVAENPDSAPFNRQTFIEAPEGQTIPGALIQQAFEESQRTREPIGEILKRVLAVSHPRATVKTIINPGPGAPEMTKRSGKE